MKVRSLSSAAYRFLSEISPHFAWIFRNFLYFFITVTEKKKSTFKSEKIFRIYPNIHRIPHLSLKIQNDDEPTFTNRWPKVAEVSNISISDSLKTVIKAQLAAYKRFCKDKRSASFEEKNMLKIIFPLLMAMPLEKVHLLKVLLKNLIKENHSRT